MKKNTVYFAFVILCVLSSSLMAIPTLQTYITGSTYGTMGNDEDTWFGGSSPFELIVAGKTSSTLSDVTLVLAVPEGAQGTVSITGGDGANLLTTAGTINPYMSANEDILTDVVTTSGFDGYDDKSFLPNVTPSPNNNHYPFKSGISDFLIYDLGSFTDEGMIHNYDGEAGTTALVANSHGEEKVYSIDVTGFQTVHFDVYGFDGKHWKINPGSHDATYVPAPGAMVLGSIGVSFIGWLRRRKTL